MAKVKQNLSRMTRLERLSYGDNVRDSVDGNPSFTAPAPEPNPALVDLDAKHDAVEVADLAAKAARQDALEKTVEVDRLDAEYSEMLTQLGAYVENVSKGDEQIILSAGMDVRDARSPVQMTQVMSLEAGFGDNGGEVDLNWDRIHGASSYEIQTSPDPITPESWTHAAVSTKSSATIDGLGTGTRCWFQVRAVGANGNGPWSDPATKIVP